jgi:excisionase family DNA binding protein
MDTAETQFLTVEQAARRLQVIPLIVQRWLRDGKIHGVQLSGRKGQWRINEAELARIGRGGEGP